MTRRDPETNLSAARARLAQVLEVARRDTGPALQNEPIVSGPLPMSTLQRKLITWSAVALVLAGLYLGLRHKAERTARSAPPGPSAPAAEPGPAAPGSIRTNPDWVRRPSGEDLARYYPMFARVLGKEGRAAIRCNVAATGLLEGCVVASEDPRGWGFGAATLEMAKGFRMRPATVNGEPVGDGKVTIPIHYAP